MNTITLIEQNIERFTKLLKMAQAVGDGEKAKFYRAMLECARQQKGGSDDPGRTES